MALQLLINPYGGGKLLGLNALTDFLGFAPDFAAFAELKKGAWVELVDGRKVEAKIDQVFRSKRVEKIERAMETSTNKTYPRDLHERRSGSMIRVPVKEGTAISAFSQSS